MDEHRDEVRFEPVSSKGVSRAVPILTFLVGIFLGAAVVKPWDLLFPPSPASVAGVPTSASPEPDLDARRAVHVPSTGRVRVRGRVAGVRTRPARCAGRRWFDGQVPP